MYQHHDHTANIAEDDKAICPVMDEPLGKQAAAENDLMRAVEGKTYSLCCKTCGTMFDKDPRQYITTKPKGE